MHWVIAAETVKSLYSRYMLWVPDLESYLSQMPKFLIFSGFLSLISSTETISPVVFLNFLSCLKKYQKRLGDNLVGGENSHPVEGSDRLALGRQLAADDPVFFECTLALHDYLFEEVNQATISLV